MDYFKLTYYIVLAMIFLVMVIVHLNEEADKNKILQSDSLPSESEPESLNLEDIEAVRDKEAMNTEI